MKKIRNLVVGILLFILAAAAGLTFMHFAGERQIEDVFSGTDITDNADEALLNMGKEKAPKKTDALWLRENSDVSFSDEDALQKAVDKIDSDFFSVVFLGSEAFGKQKDNSDYSGDFFKVKSVSEKLKAKGLKVYVAADVSFSADTFCDLAQIGDGVIITATDDLSVDKLNSELLKIKQAIFIENQKAKVYAKISPDCDKTKFNKKSVDGVYFDVTNEADAEKVKTWDKVLSIAKTRLICGIDMESILKKRADIDSALSLIYSLKDMESLSVRAFDSFKAVTKNYQNSFSAVYRYITEGIIPEIALRQVNITGYNGETVVAGEFTKDIEIYGSNLFPVYLDGKRITLGESGSKTVTLELDEEKDSYIISQKGKEIEYKVDYNFTGNLIDAVSPAHEISASPKETVKILIVAYSKAEINVRLGAKRFKAKPANTDKARYTAFIATLKMPGTIEEMESLGTVSIVASYGENSVQTQGPVITPVQQTVTVPVTKENEESTTLGFIGNYVPDLPGDAYSQTQPLPTYTQIHVPSTQPNTQPNFGVYTGNQMCVVTERYADTWPLVANDDTYVPFYTPLPYGTMDYVTAESEAYNEDDGEQVYFYELASGRKVKRSAVQLMPKQNLAANSLSVVSCTGNGGTMTIKLATNWKVPYDFYYTPQNYYSGYGKHYNVSSFTANYIQFIFYHTTSATGNIDTSHSDVVSSAAWGNNSDGVTLTMPLRAMGRYYGCSAEYDENGYLTITVHNKPQTMSGSVILLDPGHGGDDPGALGLGSAVYESNVNYALAYYTKLALEAKGATVYMTRGGDSNISLEDRKAIARSLKPDMFVSIHCNGSVDKSKIGTAVYYYKPFSQPLANNVYNSLLSVYKNNLYAGQSQYYNDLADGTLYYPFSVTRLEDCPSILIETGYMTNDSECMKLIDTNNQKLLAEAIAQGIEKAVIS